VLSIATRTTPSHDRPVHGGTLEEIAATILNEAHAQAIRHATIGRILDRADLKPHQSVSWLNSHDPDFPTTAKEICRRDLDAPSFSQHGRLVLCRDEKTGMQVLDRVAPTQPPAPGRPERREFESLRLGTRTRISTVVVPTGAVVWNLGPTRTHLDFRAHVPRVAAHFRDRKRFDWVVDHRNTHPGLELCAVRAYLNGRPFPPGALKAQEQRRAFLSDPEHKHVFHYLPVHGSWRNQVEWFFRIVARQFLKRGAFGSLKEFAARLGAYRAEYNQERAHPYRWTYTEAPLVRATPAGQMRRQRRQGRAWCGSRPQWFERLLHPPRPDRRGEKSLAANL
jgi:hypothetical protein